MPQTWGPGLCASGERREGAEAEDEEAPRVPAERAERAERAEGRRAKAKTPKARALPRAGLARHLHRRRSDRLLAVS